MIHPWDIEQVHKGWQLSPEELEQIIGAGRDTKAYQFEALGLQSRLRSELKAEGRPACVAFVKGNLRVLTDQEAVEYTAKKSASGVQKTIAADTEMSQIDIGNLSDAELVKLTSNRIASGARASALRGARTSIKRIIKAGKKKELKP